MESEKILMCCAEFAATIVATLRNVDDEAFLATICMMLEERCKSNGTDVVETAAQLAETVKRINEEYGKY